VGRSSKYPPEFRREAVELVLTSGRPRVEIARSLGVGDNTLGNWVRAERDARARAGDPEALSESERAELKLTRPPDSGPRVAGVQRPACWDGGHHDEASPAYA